MKKKKLNKLLKKLDKKVKRLFKLDLNYSIKFNLESSQTIGYFSNRKNKLNIVFNKSVFKDSKFKDFKEVIIHEYSHMIVYVLYGSVPAHGEKWKLIMKILGINNPTATTASFRNIKKKESDKLIKCGCGKRYVSSNRASRMKNGTKYICRLCSKQLKLI